MSQGQIAKPNDTLAERTYRAVLLRSDRITSPEAREEVRHLQFLTEDAAFNGQSGACIRVLAPGQFGARHHGRLYSLVDVEHGRTGTHFSLCVRRWHYIDEFNGQRYPGVASSFLCDLRPDQTIEFAGPVSYPFTVPENRAAPLLFIGMGTGIAPFRGLIRHIYEKLGRWQGPVRLFYGAKSGLDMLYMNQENDDLALYFDQPTFKAFQAVSPRPLLDASADVGSVVVQHATEVWRMLEHPEARLFLAGPEALVDQVDKAMSEVAGSTAAWQAKRNELKDSGRWQEVLY